MKKGGGSESTIFIGPSKSVLVYALHSLEYVLGLARFRVFVANIYIYIILNIKFGVNRMFHVVKTSVYRFDLYGWYRTLWTDEDNFWYCYLELLCNPKNLIWCDSDFPCAQVPSVAVWFIWEAPDLVNRYSPSIPAGLCLI